MNSDMLMYLQKRVQDEIRVIEEDMAKGTAKDYSDYKYACGTVRGLKITNGFLVELADKLENDDD